MRILITGTTGESMPPPYAGIPKLSLLQSRVWKKEGHKVAITFVYRPANGDDLGVGAEYFFEYGARPNKFKKILFLLHYFFANPLLYLNLLKSYLKIYPHPSKEAILYSAYGVFIDKVFFLFKPDIVLSEAALIKTFMAGQIAKRRKVPIVFDNYAEIHDMSIGVNPHLSEGERKKYWESFLNSADLIIAPSHYCAKGPLTYLSKEKVEVVYAGSDYGLCKLEISSNRQSLRDYLKLPQESFLVGTVGAFESRKGHDHLIKATGKILKLGYNNIEAVICGGSGDATKWKALAEEEGAEGKIHFFGRISEEDLAKVYKSLDLYCDLQNTPRASGLGMALLEAMAAGLPIVVYNNGGLPEAVPEGENGFIVPINDIEAVSKAILKIYQLSLEKRKEMGMKSSAIAAKVDINSTAQSKLALLKKVINNNFK